MTDGYARGSSSRKQRTLALGLICLMVSPAAAQNPIPATGPTVVDQLPKGGPNLPPLTEATGDRAPSVSYGLGILNDLKPGLVSISPFETRNGTRIKDLIRAGQLYLSLQDALALALENNLDLELQRYGVRMAATDTLRAKGGGTLRGILFTANEAPAGIGGPGEPLINSAATGATPQTSVPTNFNDSQLIAEAQDNLSTIGTIPLSTGPAIPQFDPSVNGQFLAQHATTPETSTVISGTPALAANTISQNFGYSQGFSPGTQVTAAFSNARNSSNSIRNLIDPYYTSTLGVTVTQPLMRGFGVELNRRFIRIGQNTQKMVDDIFRYQASITVAGVIRLYTDLVSLNEDLKVKQETLATAQRLAEDNANKVDQGTLAPVELTRAQAQVAAARQDLVNSEGFVRQQELILKNVLTRDLGSDPVIHDARIIPTDPVAVSPLPTQPAAELVRIALQFRPDYAAATKQLVNTQISLEGTRNAVRPEFDIVASATNSGLAGGPNSLYTVGAGAIAPGPGSLLGYGGNYGTALGQIFKRDYPTYSIGLNLNLPLRNRQAEADLARDELQLRQTQVRNKQLENQVRVQVEDALISIQRTKAAYEAASESRKLQEQSLAIEQERFNVGLSTNFLVIQYQSYVAQARSAEVAALGAYSKARTQLDSVMGIILRANGITLDEAFKGEMARPSTPAPAH
jgi:outer membrane protein TolC